MRVPPQDEPEAGAVLAAQRGDRDALDGLISAYLPLVYNIVGRAMSGHPDVDDVVQETMIRAMRGIAELRDPRAFRSWLVAIAMRQVRDSYRSRVAQPPPVADMAAEVAGPDFEELAISRLGLSGQRRATAEASRWLDDEDRTLLALWWQEAAGTLDRVDLVHALGQPSTHVAVAVSRMRERLDVSRMVVHALRRLPACPGLMAVTAEWDGEPSPLWRKRLARHVRDCPSCMPAPGDMVPAERLLMGLALVPVPAIVAMAARIGIGARAARPHAGRSQARRSAARHGASGRHSLLVPKAAASVQLKVAVASVALVTCAAGGTAAAVAYRKPPPAPSAAMTLRPAPSPSLATVHPARIPVPATPRTAPRPRPTPTPAPVVVTTSQKGVSTWSFTGVDQALAKSGASWYYNWGATPSGIAAPGVSYVPMIWGAANVTPGTLSEVRQEGSVLLGFNEPDLASQSNMTVGRALQLWPKLMATGMTLGSPAVAANAATPGSWLDQFMQGVKAHGYRVNFITVHWYGGNFVAASAVSELRAYLQAIYDRYHLPIWLTEFALTNFGGATPTFPTQAGQAAFLTAATGMLAGLPYVQRYAWFALPVSAGSGTTGLFSSGAVATAVGRAFEAAGKSG